MARPSRLAAILFLAACANGPASELGPAAAEGTAAELTPPAAEGTEVPLGQAVMVGRLVATPLTVIEDSRCPADAICMWQGRLVLLTRVDGDGWQETVHLSRGEPRPMHDTTITLGTVEPQQNVELRIAPDAYRFTFRGGR